MSILNIRKYGDPVLRSKSSEIGKIDDGIRKLVRDMLETMYKVEGVGLAANQIGVSKRLFVIDVSKGVDKKQAKVFINPVILSKKGETVAMEGCLSFMPKIRAEIKRAEEIIVSALNLDGKEVTVTAKDLLSRAIQHEMDHLNGVLIIDYLNFLKRLGFSKELKELKRESKV